MEAKKRPMRKCIGCGISKEKNTLVRIVLTENGLKKDPGAVLPGRGVYVCGFECLANAVRKNSFQRSFKRGFSKEELEQIVFEFAEK